MAATGSDANFFFNSMLAKALVQLIPSHEKKPLRVWFSRLLELNKTVKEVEMRDEYMWFMLMMLQCQKIREPFNHPPPLEIEPLRDLVDPKVYEEILVANGDTMQWLDRSNLNNETAPEYGPERFKASAPAKFYDNQPVPHEGVVCYIAAFSDQRYP
ncbi:uncharacterized protein LOC126747583 [Anthonomus grandis grandis]|uniref:uncharacterized protein LOC126747583 n=1 Tax=Anthonomus grandis grandis TaxID=2921223 RepID=UPI002165A0CE|nr:uncharacterized protein LOC126747583 [Anthonomus grandis grandis]